MSGVAELQEYGEGISVLLVEDNKGDARLITILLEEAYGNACRILSVPTCEAARELLCDGEFDVALIDYHLPDGLGVELVRHIAEGHADIPVILLTHHSERDVDLEAMTAGAVDFLSKNDLQSMQLERSIRYAMEQCRIEHQLRRSKSLLMRRNVQLRSLQAQLEAQTHNTMQLATHLAQSEYREKIAYILPDESERHVQVLAQHPQICMWQITPDGATIEVNPGMARLLEADSAEDRISAPYLSFFTAETRPEAEAELAKWARGVSSTFEAQVVGRRTGKVKSVVLSGSQLSTQSGLVSDLLITAVDITERRRAEAAVKELAQKDPLTGLYNRNALQEQLAQSLASANRIGRLVAVLYLDLDGFKAINDTKGHPFGDTLLKAVGHRLQSAVRASDCVARLGGDEFVVILNNLESAAAASVPAQLILDRISEPICINDETAFTGASIGVAVYPTDANDPEQLLRMADMALYRSKENGRGSYEFFDQAILERLQRRRELEPALRQAVQRDELRLMYQPQVDVVGEDVIGVEALLRWDRTEEGILGPGEFIDLAESTGLIVPVGEWVLHEACRQLRRWQDEGLPLARMAVNVSAVQLKRASFVESVKQVLDTTKVDPQSLVLEVTEGTIMEDVARATQILRALRDLGIGIALDDFGTGYASLTLLKEFPVEQIKIDRSFIASVETDSNCAAIVSATILLGHQLGLRVIGEGVETPQQLEFLREQRCEEAQGYFFGRPMWAEDCAAWIREREAGSHIPVRAS